MPSRIWVNTTAGGTQGFWALQDDAFVLRATPAPHTHSLAETFRVALSGIVSFLNGAVELGGDRRPDVYQQVALCEALR